MAISTELYIRIGAALAESEALFQSWHSGGVRAGDILDRIKIIESCQRCGESDPDCLLFHHRDPDDKLFGLSEVRNSRIPLYGLLDEILKCAVLCHNCHAKLHRAVPVVKYRESEAGAFMRHLHGTWSAYNLELDRLTLDIANLKVRRAKMTAVLRFRQKYPDTASPIDALRLEVEAMS